ncbi:TolC family protein [Oceanobacter antarcticus]|uniref:TolC family protein n=1 Tax=Oceanobacter antarcticus TaxID=3133425 RepID=A0ABW8NHL3_9GAMM
MSPEAYGDSNLAGNSTVERTRVADLPWQTFIQDERLRNVIQLALDNNRDLRATLADLFGDGATTIWSIAPSLLLPIFTAGGTDADVEYAKAGQQKSLATYEYTLQTTFREVADVLARRGTLQNQLNAETDWENFAQRSYDLSMARYKLGVDSFQDSLTSQRTLYRARQSLIATRMTDLSNRINLYRVLGGGLAAETKTTAATAVVTQ